MIDRRRRVYFAAALVGTALVGLVAAAPAAHACGVTPRDAAVRYYRAIDNRNFDGAWECLSSATRRQFRGFRNWRAGYRDMVWTRLVFAQTTGQAAGFADVRVRVRSCTATRRGARVEGFRGMWEALSGYAGWRLHDPDVRRVSRRARRRC